MESLPNLKVISQASIGFNSVDVDAAKELGIAVLNNPGYCNTEVADHTLALILGLNRRILQFNKSVQEDKEWRYDLYTDIGRLSDQVLGLYGFGAIAKDVARRAQALGMKVIASDPYTNVEEAKKLGVDIVEVDVLLEESDIISVHSPLTEETRGFFSKDKYEKMKKKPYIVNAGRGEIMKEEDLVYALDNDLIRGVALDVLEAESPDLDNSKLIGRDNVILTPHVAYYSTRSQYEIQKRSAENIDLYFKGEYDKLSIVNGVRG